MAFANPEKLTIEIYITNTAGGYIQTILFFLKIDDGYIFILKSPTVTVLL